MKKRLIQITQPLLDFCGLRLLRAKDYARLVSRENLLCDVIMQSSSTRGTPLNLEWIIFSKDRALQLHGLLSSLFHHVTGDYQVRVLYHASSEGHAQAYQEVKAIFSDHSKIQWTQETSFRSDLIAILQASSCTETCFLVDDIVFIRPLNLDQLDWPLCGKGVLSFRLGRGITYCYTEEQSETPPELTSTSCGLLEFSWMESSYDWAYPLSVDGHILSTYEIRAAAESLEYKAPNTFEQALQILTPLYCRRMGYCFEAPKLINIPLNRVQNENENLSGDISPDYLLGKWKKGKALDYMKLENITAESVHKEIAVSFCERENKGP